LYKIVRILLATAIIVIINGKKSANLLVSNLLKTATGIVKSLSYFIGVIKSIIPIRLGIMNLKYADLLKYGDFGLVISVIEC
jgi:hypothetical protein